MNKMRLQELPTELLNSIIEYLGRSFFTQDIRRLTLCKKWYTLARGLILSQLVIKMNTRTIDLFEACLMNEQYLIAIQQSVAEVELELRGLESWALWSRSAYDLLRVDYPPTSQETIKNVYYSQMFEGYLRILLEVLQSAPRLRRLRFSVTNFNFIDLPDLRTLGLAHDPTIVMGLFLRSGLTALELDLGPCLEERLWRNLHLRPDALHTCVALTAHLPTLRRLRCRLSQICEDFLSPPASFDQQINLEECVVVYDDWDMRSQRGGALRDRNTSMCSVRDISHYMVRQKKRQELYSNLGISVDYTVHNLRLNLHNLAARVSRPREYKVIARTKKGVLTHDILQGTTTEVAWEGEEESWSEIGGLLWGDS